VPLRLFRSRNLSAANAVGVLVAAAMFGWFFLSALYLQRVVAYSPLQVGLAFLPAMVLMGAFSLGLSARIVMRFGIRAPLATGVSLFAVGLLFFVRAPVDGTYVADVLPGMLLLGLGGGISFNPMLLAAMSDVEPAESGLASGVVNTAQMMGGALGLAVLASLATSRTRTLESAGHAAREALNGGYHAAFVVGAAFAAVGVAVGRARARPRVRAGARRSAGSGRARVGGGLTAACLSGASRRRSARRSRRRGSRARRARGRGATCEPLGWA
jgi:hypothetical protein